MNQMAADLDEDETLRDAYLEAHRDYLRRRAAVAVEFGVGPVPEIEEVSAGGMPDRVKCLHALAGHALAAGPGVNPLGTARWPWSPSAVCGSAPPRAST